jgi:replicative superfamily II helicase
MLMGAYARHGEPSLGLASLIVRDNFHIIADLRRSGVAMLLVEQDARAALQVRIVSGSNGCRRRGRPGRANVNSLLKSLRD